MDAMTSQITSLTSVYSIVYSGTDQRKHQSTALSLSPAFVSPVNSPHKGTVTRKLFPFDDVIMDYPQKGPIVSCYVIKPRVSLGKSSVCDNSQVWVQCCYVIRMACLVHGHIVVISYGWLVKSSVWLNTLRPRQHGCHFADDTFKRIFLNENVRISIKIY